VFNRTVALRDSWAKIEKKQAAAGGQRQSASADEAANVALVSIEDFGRLDLKTAVVREAEAVPDADRLLKLRVDLGGETRQIVAGIAGHYTPEELLGRTIVVVANLEPATIRGVRSEGMLLAAKKKKKLRLLTVENDLGAGAAVG
jgi:methionyl-tRNA synthetase